MKGECQSEVDSLNSRIIQLESEVKSIKKKYEQEKYFLTYLTDIINAYMNGTIKEFYENDKRKIKKEYL